VGSQEGIKTMINLTAKQKFILYGAILGDGFLQKTGSKNARLRLEQGAKQKEYLFWKVGMLSLLFQGKPRKVERIHLITKNQYSYWRHQSQANPFLGKLRNVFYPQGKKIIPQNIEKCLNPASLAVWYMDDGYYYLRDKCGYLYLGNVSQTEAETLQNALKNKFQLCVHWLKKKKGYAIYFPPTEMRKLKLLLKGLYLEQFNYKFPS